MRIATLVAMPHGEHDPDKAVCLCVGSLRKVVNARKEFTKKHRGFHEDYFYIKVLGTQNPRSTRFSKPVKEAVKAVKKDLTEGAKKAVKAAGLSDEQIQSIKAGSDNKIYKVEAEAFIKNLA